MPAGTCSRGRPRRATRQGRLSCVAGPTPCDLQAETPGLQTMEEYDESQWHPTEKWVTLCTRLWAGWFYFGCVNL